MVSVQKFILYIAIILGFAASFLITERAFAVPPVDITIGVGGSGASTGGPLAINRVELQFENGRGDMTVPLNGELKVKAFINYTGNGVLEGQWLVDGRVIQQVSNVLTYGNDIVIESLKVPPFPTFNPGGHTVTFNVISPVLSFTAPTIRYFVDTTSVFGKKTGLRLSTPGDGMTMYKDEVAFSWSDLARTGLYRVIVWDGSRSVINALTRNMDYRPPDKLLERLSEGMDYTWEIAAVDRRGLVAGKSGIRSLRIRHEPDAVVFRDLQINSRAPGGMVEGVIPSEESFNGSRDISLNMEVNGGEDVNLVAVLENWKRDAVQEMCW